LEPTEDMWTRGAKRPPGIGVILQTIDEYFISYIGNW